MSIQQDDVCKMLLSYSIIHYELCYLFVPADIYQAATCSLTCHPLYICQRAVGVVMDCIH